MKEKWRILCCFLFLFLLPFLAFGQYDGTNGPGISNEAHEAGTILIHMTRGGRTITFHRGYLYIMGETQTTLWDVSDFTNPVQLGDWPIGDNGHRWWKLNTDIFWREYSVPEVTGSGYHFLDMSDMLDLKPFTGEAPCPILESGSNLKWQFLETFPIGTNGANVHDNRTQDPLTNPDEILAIFEEDGGDLHTGVFGSMRFRIGNLMFIVGQGLAVYDVGDPRNITFLDSLSGQYTQYTTTYQIWRNHVVYVNGDDSNEGGNNLVTIDFSDPMDLKFGFGMKYVDSPGRYIWFQDEFGFIGDNEYGTKINMETQTVERRLEAAGPWPKTLLDFQWIPAGAAVVASGDNGADGKTTIIQHQDGPDTRGPEVGFHHPFADSMGNPESTVIGFVIAETLDERTINDQTIQVRIAELGEEPIEGDIVHSSYQIFNFCPKEPLVPDKTYEVTLVQDGIKDIAGNGIDEFVFHFSTGNSLVVNEKPKIHSISYGSDTPVEVGQHITFFLDASDLDNDPLEFRWDFNDGNGNTEWRSSNTITYTYPEKGLKKINVQVRDDKGGVGASARGIVVIDGPPGPAPVHSGPMALDPKDRKLVVVNPDNDTVTFINPDTMVKTGEYPVSADPRSVTIDNYGQIWVACMDDNVVDVLNPNGTLNVSIGLGRGCMPFGILASPDGANVYVAEQATGEITKIDASTNTVVDSIYVGKIPRALAITGDGSTLYATRLISQPTHGTVYKVDLASFRLETEIDLPADTTTADTGTSSRGVPNNRWGIAVHPSNEVVYSVGKKDNIFVGLSRDGRKNNHDTIVRSAITYIDMATDTEIFEKRKDIDNHSNPSAITFNPNGTHMIVAEQNNNLVFVFNPDNNLEVTRAHVGLAPQGVLYDTETHRIFVKNLNSRTVTVLDANEMTNRGGIALPEIATIETVANELMAPEVLLGKQVFYNAEDERMSFEGYFTCASCHTDGDHDGMVMDKAPDEGFRNTKSFIGKGGTNYGDVQWTANVDEMQDFEMGSRGNLGKGFIPNDLLFTGTRAESLGDSKAGLSVEQDAIAAYIATFTTFPDSPYRNEDGSLTADGQAGKAIFENFQCGLCHGETTFTDSPRGYFHDVGTIKETSGQRLYMPLLGIDTPTLRDVWRTWPYLHDGTAETLMDVIDLNTDDAHGVTSGLSTTEKEQLVSYMLQIDGTEPAPATPLLNLEIGSFTDGQQFSDTVMPLAINTDLTGISLVTYHSSGVEIARASSAPWETTWVPDHTGKFLMQAVVTWNNGNTKSVTAPTDVIMAGVCTITYEIIAPHPTGAQIDVTITNNTSTDINGYELVWTLGPDEAVDTGWNATITTSGSVVTASNPAGHWNGTIPANGGTAAFGFLILVENGDAIIPNDFMINGNPCSVAEGGGETPTDGPTATPTADVTPVATPGPTDVPTSGPGTIGDVDEDGDIDIIDALLVAQYYVQLDPSGFTAPLEMGDTDCDGDVDIVDALLIAQTYVGLDPVAWCG